MSVSRSPDDLQCERSGGTGGQESAVAVSALKCLHAAEVREEYGLCRDVAKLSHGHKDSMLR